jgi:hypothetical protein
MARGSWNGVGVEDATVRSMFTREYLLASDWYHERLARQQRNEIRLLERHEKYLNERAQHVDANSEPANVIAERVGWLKRERARISSADYVQSLLGTLGADAITE